jgi:LuxR family maltose regulon positive regulatory protein
VSHAAIAVPRLSSRHVPRPRLLAAVDRAVESGVVLVCAPAGYGKTLLLADWATHHPDRTAWVNLDGHGGDDRSFWSAVVAALASCATVPAGSALHTLTLPDAPSLDPGFLAAVTNAVDALGGPVALVLDDVHELTGDPLHGLAALVRDRPARLLLVLSSRLDPPVRLDRLRLTGHLAELRAHDLAFTPDEAQALLAGATVTLSASQLQILVDETDGWAAGLRLVALALQDVGDPGPVLIDLVRNERAISDYLVGEILSRLPAAVLDVLTAVSLCDEVTAQLAVAVAGRADAGDLLATLEHETSLVTSYGEGRRWFRVHPLLRAHLRAGLQRRRPDLATAGHGRAARWLARAGELDLGLHHAGLAGDPDLLGGLLRDHGAGLATSGHHEAVSRALDLLPQGWSRRDPALALVAATARVEAGRMADADRFLADADAAWPAEPDAALTAARYLARTRRAWFGPQWDVARFAPPADSGTGDSSTGDPGTDVVALLVRSTTAIGRGELRTAVALAQQAVDRAAADRNAYLVARATAHLGVCHGRLGDGRTMIALAARSEELAPAEGWRGTIGHAYARQMLAYGALLQARAADVLVALDDLDDVVEEQGNRIEIDRIFPAIEIFRHAARFDLDDQRSALHAMQTVRAAMRHSGGLDRSATAAMALLEHGAAVRLGRRDDARAVVAWAEDHLGPTGDVLFLRACGPAAISRHDVARQHLRPLLDGGVAPVMPWVPLAGWVLECALLLRTAGRPAARAALARALVIAGATGVLRPLVLAPDDVVALMADHRGEGEPVVHQVLAMRRIWRSPAPATPLTQRECEVLEMLPTVMSLEEIAEALAVSVNTVKTHVRAVYAKVGARTRWEAVDAARRAGLLDPAHRPAAVGHNGHTNGTRPTATTRKTPIIGSPSRQ